MVQLQMVTLLIMFFPAESRRNDVILPEEPNAAATSNATDFSRIGWLN